MRPLLGGVDDKLTVHDSEGLAVLQLSDYADLCATRGGFEFLQLVSSSQPCAGSCCGRILDRVASPVECEEIYERMMVYIYALICSAQATSVLVALDDSMSSCRMQQDDHDIAQERTLLFRVVAPQIGVANCDPCLLHIAPARHAVW